MADTPARLLRLLSALQARRHWSGPELAAHLEVTDRTVRRDIDRLRALGYPVEAAPGVTGGYQLGVAGELPPLLLDDDEATAIVAALSVLAGSATGGIEQAALAALAKIDRVLPARLRPRARALRDATVALTSPSDPVDADTLVTLAQATDSNERLLVHYVDRDERHTQRRLDPHALVATGRRWYLVAHDVDRDDWRTLRVDRMRSVQATGHRFARRRLDDAAAMVTDAISSAPYRYQAIVVFDLDPKVLRQRVPPTVGRVSAHERGAALAVGSDDLNALLGHLVALGEPFDVLEPRELRERARELGRVLSAPGSAGTSRRRGRSRSAPR